MITAKVSTLSSELGTQVLARIDGTDVHFVMPLREFLEAYGCQVLVNENVKTEPRYHLICGDALFVKDIFLTLPSDSRRLLLIIWNARVEESKNYRQKNVKVVLIDPRPLTEPLVEEIFSFFFTSPAQVLDLRQQTQNLPAEEKKEEYWRAANQEDLTLIETNKPPVAAQQFVEEEDRRRISETISAVFGGKSVQAKTETHARVASRRGFRVSWRTGILAAAIILLAPFFWYLVGLSASTSFLWWGSKMLLGGNIKNVRTTSNFSNFWTNQSRLSLNLVTPPLTMLGLGRQVRGQESLVALLEEMAVAQSSTAQVLGIGKDLANVLLAGIQGTPSLSSSAANIEKLRTELFSVQNHLGLSYAQLKLFLEEGTSPFSILSFKNLGKKGLVTLANLRRTTQYVDNLLALFPLSGGFREKQVYLVLLQNNMELRPTGGFIGSLALATLSDGRLEEVSIQDVYTADGQLKGHVDPPRPIKELLGQEHWYLRDSNWDPDFSLSGSRAAWFFEKETGIAVDGVIAMNTAAITEFLRLTGPLSLPDYNDRITADNFFGKSLFYTQTDFFPGSTQKKDFLGSLANALVDKLTSSKNVPPAAVFRVITGAIDRHDILFYFNDPRLESLVDSFGWAGRVPVRQDCLGNMQASCFFDGLALVEANLGVNKANYFVKRSGTRQIAIGEDGIATETITLVYRNSASSDAIQGGGVYRNYLRFILPSDSQLSLITLDTVRVVGRDPKQKAPPPVPYWETEESSAGVNVVAVALDVPPGKESRLTLSYRRGRGMSFGPEGAIYELFMQKQPGVSETPWQTTVKYPIFWAATAETENSPQEAVVGSKLFLAKETQLEYNTTLTRDDTIRIRFNK